MIRPSFDTLINSEVMRSTRPSDRTFKQRSFKGRLLHCLCLLLSVMFSSLALGLECANFELDDSYGQSHKLSDSKQRFKVIAFLGTECPLAKLYSQRLNDLSAEFREHVAILGLNANCQDSNSDIANFVKRHELQFPILKDLRNEVANQLQATRTPEVFLLDEKNQVRYQGRIDDQYGVGYAKSKPTKSDLRDAIVCLTEGRDIATTKTEAVGCLIGRLPVRSKKSGAGGNSEVTIAYDTHIVPLLEKHCVECHQDGEIAPFALTAYDEVIGWAETIREVIEDQRMPPWHADPDVGSFANARTMNRDEKATFSKWIDDGMPRGTTTREPKRQAIKNEWLLPREPDVVLSMHETGFDVPAEGTVEYQYFVVDPQFQEDQWVSAAQVVPGERSAVHHVIVFVRPPEGERETGLGWLTGYVPGQTNTSLPAGYARRVPAGSKLVFQMHYTPTGSVVRDNTKLGLLFAKDEDVHTEVQTQIVIDRNFEIPPHTKDHSVKMQISNFPQGSKLMAVAPHMHYRGSKFRAWDGPRNDDPTWSVATANPLLFVPNYDFNWQHAYRLTEHLPLDDRTIYCEALFDNSTSNLTNPDPSITVRWGDQTWEEMAMAYLVIAIPRGSKSQLTAQQILSENQPKGPQNSTAEQREEEAQQLTQAFFDRLDANQDREILRAETPKSFRAFAWRYYDLDGDDKLTWEEVVQHARASLDRTH